MLSLLLALAAQNEICVPASGTPTLDGGVVGDLGWDGSARIDLDCPGAVPETWARWTRTATHVYLGLVVTTPGLAPNPNDRIVLALRTHDDATAWRIHITPFGLSTPLGPGHPQEVKFWRNSATWNGNVIAQTPSTGNATWLMPDQIHFDYSGGDHWELELRMPIESNVGSAGSSNAVYFPPVGTAFRVYLNLVKTEGASGYAFQYPWRSGSTLKTSITKGTPPFTDWGTASFDNRPGCAVQLYCTKLGLSGTNPHEVVPMTPPAPFGDCAAVADNHMAPVTGPPNTFFAKPRNRMAAVAKVRTAFDVSDWGVPAPDDWWKVAYPETWPAPMTNPSPTADIAPGGEGMNSLDWPLTYKQSCQLAVIHKSIRATMSRPDGDDVTHFGANPVQRCYDPVSASVFQRDARIGSRGHPGAPSFVLTVGKEVVRRPASPPVVAAPAAAPLAVAALAARRPTLNDALLYEDPAEIARRSFTADVEETLHWVCRAFRKTGQSLEIDGRSFEDTVQAGSFGYLAGHRGPVERWSAEFSGAGLRRRSEGVFELDVAQGQKGLVHTRIEAESFHEWALRARIGAAIPHGDFADAVDGGWSELVSLEYRINRMFSLEGRLGVSMFDGESGGPDVYSVQHAVNGRVTFLEGPLRPFVNAGPGFYANNPGDDDFGFNAGAGLGYRLSDRLTLEAAWDYHHVFAEGDDPQYSTLQLGVGLKF